MNVYDVTPWPQVTVTVQERRQYTLDAASAEVAGRTRYIQHQTSKLDRKTTHWTHRLVELEQVASSRALVGSEGTSRSAGGAQGGAGGAQGGAGRRSLAPSRSTPALKTHGL